MADHFLQARENLKHTFSLSDLDTNIEFLNQFSGLNPSHQENFHGLMGFPCDNLFPHTAEFPGNLESVKELFIHEEMPSLNENVILNSNGDKKRKERDIYTPESSSANSSALASSNGCIRRKNSSGKGKRVKGNEKEEEKPKEVVHVRAKRGQATDSHSLAERVRRGKINERLRCLQDIVPGCYKSMGMAVMLDEIINYVQSLQNQVEFLSMKLTAASTFHDLDTNTLETLQRAKALEQLKIQNTSSQGLMTSMQLNPLDLNFGYFPQLPHNRF